ncbi:aspartate dehydrogenase [Methanolacinia petrolearia DSM 11571]|uniref:L-aspartate dehydrogenase n=1 Tax=Methanolacinia petrolearia (strain DSM 11571 / OCM 486 / SEBR 4847) TaxID=679926 RepID=E1RGD9_METP4|nr:aspartate dehydrogenase [Methanolacinia petrolearia]ADN37453.1 aspartate dehydrogenase [Methanolacinia petrolearia DSM 11571]
MIKVGLLGCGNVAHVIAKETEGFSIKACFDLMPRRAEEISKLTGAGSFSSFEEFIKEDLDIVVEAASVTAVHEFAREVLENGKDIVILSVGALADPGLKNELKDTAKRTGRKIYIPSGAIMGLDNLKIGRISNISKLLLRTTKNPRSLGIETDKKTMVFSGRADECIRQFPKNINVAIALELATGHDVEVELWADPDLQRNTHEIIVEGDFGNFYLKIENKPCPDNPATSYLAALSIITLLRNLEEPIKIGT